MTVQSSTVRTGQVVGPSGVSSPAAMAKATLDVARGELGYQEGPNNYNKFSPALGMQNVPWCAAFVSHVLNKTGAGEGILVNGGSASVSGLQSQFTKAGRFVPPSGTPQPGDVIFLNPSHTGIVEKVENGRVYTIEGNTTNGVARRSYELGKEPVRGYGRTFGAPVSNADSGAPENIDSLAQAQRSGAPSLNGGVQRGSDNNVGTPNWQRFSTYDAFIEMLLAMVNGDVDPKQLEAVLKKMGLSPAQAKKVAKHLKTMKPEQLAQLRTALQTNPALIEELKGLKPSQIPAKLDEIVALGRPEAAWQAKTADLQGTWAPR